MRKLLFLIALFSLTVMMSCEEDHESSGKWKKDPLLKEEFASLVHKLDQAGVLDANTPEYLWHKGFPRYYPRVVITVEEFVSLRHRLGKMERYLGVEFKEDSICVLKPDSVYKKKNAR